ARAPGPRGSRPSRPSGAGPRSPARAPPARTRARPPIAPTAAPLGASCLSAATHGPIKGSLKEGGEQGPGLGARLHAEPLADEGPAAVDVPQGERAVARGVVGPHDAAVMTLALGVAREQAPVAGDGLARLPRGQEGLGQPLEGALVGLLDLRAPRRRPG